MLHIFCIKLVTHNVISINYSDQEFAFFQFNSFKEKEIIMRKREPKKLQNNFGYLIVFKEKTCLLLYK